jgi:Phosphate transport (Pho88)
MVNKLFIMVPAMLASRKLDSEDPNQVFWLRVAYGTIQSICLLIVVYTYIHATSIAAKNSGGTIYVAPAPQVRSIAGSRSGGGGRRRRREIFVEF